MGIGLGIAQCCGLAAQADNGSRANRMNDRMGCPFSRSHTLGQFPANSTARPCAPFVVPSPMVAAAQAVTHGTKGVSRCGDRGTAFGGRASCCWGPRFGGYGADASRAERVARAGVCWWKMRERSRGWAQIGLIVSEH